MDAFDNRIHAGATDATHYEFALPHGWQRRDVHVATTLYYRRAFKPFADERKLNVPMNGNPHGTRGDGSDYDENVVMASTSTFLACRHAVSGLHAATFAANGPLELVGTLKLSKDVPLDASTDGVRVSLGDATATSTLLHQDVRGFVTSGDKVDHQGQPGDAVGDLSLKRAGAHAYHVTLDLQGLSPAALTQGKLLFALDSGRVCFRNTLRCKTKKSLLRCR